MGLYNYVVLVIGWLDGLTAGCGQAVCFDLKSVLRRLNLSKEGLK